MPAGPDSGEVIVARFPFDTLDATNMAAVREDLFRLANECRTLILDFHNVTYLSSPALGTLISLHKKLTMQDRGLVLCNLDPQIAKHLAITKLDTVFTINRDEDLDRSAVVATLSAEATPASKPAATEP